MNRVLVVEDDNGIMAFVRLELEHEGFDVVCAYDGRGALEAFKNQSIDIVILDIMLPGISGLEVLRRIRKSSSVPVILVTARGETYDKVNGLDAGADDYIVKPFEIEELLARMRSVIRRAAPASKDTSLKYKALELRLDSMSVLLNGVNVCLSKTEFLLLRTLLENKNTVLSRGKIISAVWGKGHYIEDNSVDVYIRYLRAKIDDKAGEEYIATVRGAGYIIKE